MEELARLQGACQAPPPGLVELAATCSRWVDSTPCSAALCVHCLASPHLIGGLELCLCCAAWHRRLAGQQRCGGGSVFTCGHLGWTLERDAAPIASAPAAAMENPLLRPSLPHGCRRCRAETAVAGRVCRHCKLEERFWQWEASPAAAAPASAFAALRFAALASQRDVAALAMHFGRYDTERPPATSACALLKGRNPLPSHAPVQGRAFALYSKAREGAGAVTAEDAIRQAQQASRGGRSWACRRHA